MAAAVMRLFLALSLLIGLLAAGPAPAAPASATVDAGHTRVALVASTLEPRPGSTVQLGLVMTAAPGWHTYWKNPGDAGIETRADWKLPTGFSVSPFAYPVPETFMVGGIMNHVYKGEAVLVAELKVPQAARGDFTIGGRFDWLVCDDSLCVPESATLSLPMRAGEGAPGPDAATLEAARAALPLAAAEPGQVAREGGRLRLLTPVAAAGIRRAHFFAAQSGDLLFASPQALSVADGRLMIETDADPNGPPAPRAVEGVLRLEHADGRVTGIALAATPGPVPPGTPLAATGAPPNAALPAFLPAFAAALLGGLLLNLMPCVFPILSLKAMSLARAGTSAYMARVEGLAYAAGVILACTALGGVAIALASAGAGAGWAFQLQDPRVILFLLLLVLGIGLNFAGLFEMSLGSLSGRAMARPGPGGAFVTGLLAAFIATPCTGPFMAGALGAALILPPVAGLAVFAGLGLGLALPFLLIGFVPALRQRLPRPGPWMETFRHILAIPMLLTAVALAWVLGRQAGVNALSFGLVAALLLALGLWWLGLRQKGGRPGIPGALLAGIAAIVAPLLLPRLVAPADAAPGETAAAAIGQGLEAQPFSAEALAEARASGQPVFLYFTADWCVTCKVNERGALSSPEVAQAFDAAGIRVMVGDWTRPDPAIATFLASHGRAGIPLYLFYAADGSVRELPQLLTPAMLTDLGQST
jgi:thiol:disulfide interchange protein/DsbC/DsbD-like thiol-disulfide interchange protein